MRLLDIGWVGELRGGMRWDFVMFADVRWDEDILGNCG